MRSNSYSFRLSPEKIREFKDLPPEEKLDWLEEANNFISIAVSPDKMERWERIYKSGESN